MVTEPTEHNNNAHFDTLAERVLSNPDEISQYELYVGAYRDVDMGIDPDEPIPFDHTIILLFLSRNPAEAAVVRARMRETESSDRLFLTHIIGRWSYGEGASEYNPLDSDTALGQSQEDLVPGVPNGELSKLTQLCRALRMRSFTSTQINQIAARLFDHYSTNGFWGLFEGDTGDLYREPTLIMEVVLNNTDGLIIGKDGAVHLATHITELLTRVNLMRLSETTELIRRFIQFRSSTNKLEKKNVPSIWDLENRERALLPNLKTISELRIAINKAIYPDGIPQPDGDSY